MNKNIKYSQNFLTSEKVLNQIIKQLNLKETDTVYEIEELLEGKETLVKGIKNKEKKPYNAVVKIGEKGYIDFISFSK